jgi:hypothetical protein
MLHNSFPVVLAKAGTHTLRAGDAEGVSHAGEATYQAIPSVVMGPRLREDDIEFAGQEWNL